MPNDHEFDHPAGAFLARCLQAELDSGGWRSYPFDNWRDCGWCVPCRKAETRCDIVFCNTKGDNWFMQIAPDSTPGIIGSVLAAAEVV